MSGKYKQICWLLKPPELWLPNISWHSHGTKPAVSAFQVRGQAALQMSDSLTHPPHTQNDTSTCRHTGSEAQTTEWFAHPAKLSSQRAATNIAKNSLRINEFGRQGTIQRPCLVQAGTFYCKGVRPWALQVPRKPCWSMVRSQRSDTAFAQPCVRTQAPLHFQVQSSDHPLFVDVTSI